MRNILKKVRSKDKKKIMEDFKEVLSMDEVNNSVAKAVKRLDKFIEKWKIIYRNIDRLFENKKEYFSYTKFPYQMRRMIYINNWIENLNKQIRRTTKIRNSFPNEQSAEKLVMLKCMEIEDNYMKYPITSLLPVKDVLDDMLLQFL